MQSIRYCPFSFDSVYIVRARNFRPTLLPFFCFSDSNCGAALSFYVGGRKMSRSTFPLEFTNLLISLSNGYPSALPSGKYG